MSLNSVIPKNNKKKNIFLTMLYSRLCGNTSRVEKVIMETKKSGSPSSSKGSRQRRFSTDSVHGHDFYDSRFGLFKVPIFQTAVWEQIGAARKTERDTDLKYSREENVTVNALEKVLSKIEGADDTLAFNSGMSAIVTAYMSALKSGDKVVITLEAYGTTQQMSFCMEKYGVKTILGGPETQDIIDSITGDTNMVIVETITNPLLKVIDIREISKRCSEVGAKLLVDNTFATPLLLRPIKEGAWVSLNSLTKYLAGHNDVIGGSVTGDKETIKELWDWRRRLGTILNPFEAFLILRGISTFKVRFTAQSKAAMKIAEYLSDHPKIEGVYYPGLKDNPYHSTANRIFYEKTYGGVLSFKIKGGKDGTINFLRKLKVIRASPSLGGVESLATYPILSASFAMTQDVREALGITENLIRLSVGLEDVEDLKEDLDQALSGA